MNLYTAAFPFVSLLSCFFLQPLVLYHVYESLTLLLQLDLHSFLMISTLSIHLIYAG